MMKLDIHHDITTKIHYSTFDNFSTFSLFNYNLITVVMVIICRVNIFLR